MEKREKIAAVKNLILSQIVFSFTHEMEKLLHAEEPAALD